jgi:DNA-binding Lrp family transcriptional regulator
MRCGVRFPSRAPPGRGRRAAAGHAPARTAANDRRTVEEFEAGIVAFDEVIAVRRLFGKPDYFVTVAVADAEAFEAFQMSRLIGLPAVARAVSHLTMTRLEG